MSFILDALKKSENERQRQAGPGFATVPESSGARPRKIWPFVVAVLLAVNLVVIGAILMRDRPARTTPDIRPTAQPSASPSGTQSSNSPRRAPASTSSTTSTAPEPAEQATAAGDAPATTGPGPDRQVRSLAEEVRGGRSTGAVAGGDSGEAAATAEPAPTPASAAATRQASTPTRQAPSSSVDSMPTSNDLRLEGFLTGPPLHLDLHVYYPDHQRRVVFISGSKYREGDTIKGGTLVREIVPEGVILEERGRRYLLTPD